MYTHTKTNSTAHTHTQAYDDKGISIAYHRTTLGTACEATTFKDTVLDTTTSEQLAKSLACMLSTFR